MLNPDVILFEIYIPEKKKSLTLLPPNGYKIKDDCMKLKIVVWLTVFTVAMGYLESSVVVYLREIMYPAGFDFPLAFPAGKIALTEIIREAATIIMLVGLGVLAGKNFTERFAAFIYCFAVWDLFYYVFLKAILGWPVSLLTWDILFLIPVPWTSPVICPVIVSLTMILLALIIFWFNKTTVVKLQMNEWLILTAGSVIIVLSFIWDYAVFVLGRYSFSTLLSPDCGDILTRSGAVYIPHSFNWVLFGVGEVVILSAVLILDLRLRKEKQKGL